MCSNKKIDFEDCFEFVKYYMRIYHLYNKYGDRVIEVEFEEMVNEYDEQIKNAFESNLTSKEIEKTLADIWNHYIAIIISSVDDLKKVPIRRNLVVSSGSSSCHKFSITDSFFKQIIKYKYESNKTYAIDDSYIYIIAFDELGACRILERISIAEKVLKD